MATCQPWQRVEVHRLECLSKSNRFSNNSKLVCCVHLGEVPACSDEQACMRLDAMLAEEGCSGIVADPGSWLWPLASKAAPTASWSNKWEGMLPVTC